MHPFPPSPVSSTMSNGDDDAITPIYENDNTCWKAAADTPLRPVEPSEQQPCCPLPSPLPSASFQSSPAASLDNTTRLWRRMLALQRRYHCYNSARVSAALADSSVAATVPSRACLDLLNDSIDRETLPDAARNDISLLFAHLEDASHLGMTGFFTEDEDEDEDTEHEHDDTDGDVELLDLGLPLLPLVATAQPAGLMDTKEEIELEELEELGDPEEQREPSEPTDRAWASSRKLGQRFGLRLRVRLDLRLPTWRRQRLPWQLRLRV